MAKLTLIEGIKQLKATIHEKKVREKPCVNEVRDLVILEALQNARIARVMEWMTATIKWQQDNMCAAYSRELIEAMELSEELNQ